MVKKKKKQRGNNMQQSERNSQVEPETETAEPVEMETPAEEAEETDTPVQAEEAQEESKQDEALAAALAKQEEYLNMAQRVQADFENFRRRNQNVRKEAYDDGARAFAATLLPVIDNLERAIAAAQNSPDESLRSGVEMVHRQLCEAFDKRGIKPIDRKGEKFDPALENAVMQGAPEDGEPGTVCEVFQKGYQLDGMVLRHAMVKVVPE